MLPVFSLRSLLGILIGLIIGIAGGFGYAAFTSADGEFHAEWPPVTFGGQFGSNQYETSIQGRVLPIQADGVSTREMDGQQQYYAAKLGSMPFFQYLSEAVETHYPQFAHPAEELARQIEVKVISPEDNTSVILVKGIFPTREETLFFIQNIPLVFDDYLINEQNGLQVEAYVSKLSQIEDTRTALTKAGQELLIASINLKPEGEPDPTTVSGENDELSAKIALLEKELINRMSEAAFLLGPEYFTTSSGGTPAATVPSAFNPYDIIAGYSPEERTARIKEMEEVLISKACARSGFKRSAGFSNSFIPSVDNNKAISNRYISAVNNIEEAATELGKAKSQMDIRQARVFQEHWGSVPGNETAKLACNRATEQINSLVNRLDSDTQELQVISQAIPASQTVRFYAENPPARPVPLESGTGIVILGALLGMFGGWLVVNGKWLAGRRPVPEGAGASLETEAVEGDEDEDTLDDEIEALRQQRLPGNYVPDMDEEDDTEEYEPEATGMSYEEEDEDYEEEDEDTEENEDTSWRIPRVPAYPVEEPEPEEDWLSMWPRITPEGYKLDEDENDKPDSTGGRYY